MAETLLGTAAQTAAPAAESPTASTATSTAPASQTYNFGGKTYNSVDDLGKAYESLQSEYGKWTSKYGDLEKQYNDINQRASKWDEWWNTIRPYWGEDVESLLRQKLTGQTQKTQVASQAEDQAIQSFWNNYENMQPHEQGQKMAQYVGQMYGPYLQNQFAELAKAVNDTFVQKEQWYQAYLQNHLGLLRKAIERKMQDPNFNIDETMEWAAKAIGGQLDPIQLGQQLINAQSFQAQLDAAKKAAYEQGKKDFEQEQTNNKQESVPVVPSVPIYKIPSLNNGQRKGLASMREAAAKNIYDKFGPQWFARE